MAEQPPKYLSAYGLFRDAGKQLVNDGLVPYDLITPLFTDYALKYRFVHIPAGKAARYTPDGVFEFPVGSMLVKTFAYPADFRRPTENIRLLETRLLIRKPSGWAALPYVWNADQRDARLKRGGKRIPISWTGADGKTVSFRYRVPNVNQCKGCHVRNKRFSPIGPKARNLNHDFDYGTGRENQLVHWSEAGILSDAPERAAWPHVPRWDDPQSGTLAERARGYLDVNCAHCHNPDGPASTSGLFLDFTETRPRHWGVNKPPVAAGRGAGDLAVDIDPGKPDRSILAFRMNSVDPGIMMPELGRQLVHKEGVALIRQWIAAMDSDGR
jgi:uncharacterized repeat protein (TIGR03806 family)